MAQIRPFKAIRPIKSLADKVAALPYDVMDSDEAREMVKGNPYSFLHVDKAEIDLPHDTYLYDKKVYEKAKDNLQKMIDSKIMIQDSRPHLYIYRQIRCGRAQTGVVACASIDDYIENVIKKHEKTRAEKEEDRFNHVNYCDANTGPIFLTYKSKKEINDIVEKCVQKQPEYDFKSEDGVSQIVWVINDNDTIDKLCSLFKEVKYMYIADGHHRAASAVKVGKLRRKQNPNYTGDEEFNFFLSVIFPDSDLYIMDYNRVVSDLNNLTVEEYLDKISVNFEVQEYEGEGCFKPTIPHTFGMYLDKKWYKLTAKPGTFDKGNPISKLDVSILQDNLLAPVLGITDPGKDQRIDFIGGIRGLKELKRRVDHGMRVAFAMYPTTIKDLMDIADAGEIMPQKSTWFEPKLRSGLFIHKLK